MLARFRAQLPLKLLVLAGLGVGICVPYFSLQQLGGPGVWTPPTLWLDRAIAFDPRWVVAYHSIDLLVPLVPLLATRRDELIRYARGLALLCVPCFVVFWLLPVDGPRPVDVADAPLLYDVLVTYDGRSNSLPSLHAGLTVYSLLFGFRLLRDAGSRRTRTAAQAAALVWGGAILYSTLATRQHWAFDLPLGMLAGWLACHLAWRRGGVAARIERSISET